MSHMHALMLSKLPLDLVHPESSKKVFHPHENHSSDVTPTDSQSHMLQGFLTEVDRL
jgi:hypothetical protein